jgi:hypothetical protein
MWLDGGALNVSYSQSQQCVPGSRGISRTDPGEIVRITVIGPEGGRSHEVHGHVHFSVGSCPPIKGELDLRLQIKVRRGLRFVWVTVGAADKKNVGGLPENSEFTMHVYHHCNPRGRASYRLRLHAAPGINGDGSASPPKTEYLPRDRGIQLHCR